MKASPGNLMFYATAYAVQSTDPLYQEGMLIIETFDTTKFRFKNEARMRLFVEQHGIVAVNHRELERMRRQFVTSFEHGETQDGPQGQ